MRVEGIVACMLTALGAAGAWTLYGPLAAVQICGLMVWLAFFNYAIFERIMGFRGRYRK